MATVTSSFTKDEHLEQHIDTDPTETIIQSLGGTFVKFQVVSLILFALPFALSGSFALNYVFTALNVDHRFV